MSVDSARQYETDKRFPSGLWMGYWMQGNIKGRMRLTLEFINGSITGAGTGRTSASIRGQALPCSRVPGQRVIGVVHLFPEDRRAGLPAAGCSPPCRHEDLTLSCIQRTVTS